MIKINSQSFSLPSTVCNKVIVIINDFSLANTKNE